MKPYPQYKDSGVEWIGSIPESWMIERTKYILFERKELSEEGKEDLLSVSEYYGVARRADKIALDDILVRAESLSGYKIAYENDLVINIMLAWKKALGVNQQYGIVSPAYCVYSFFSAFFPKYFHYLFRTDMYADIFKANSTGIIDSRLRLYTENLFSIEAIIPPLSEQTTIAAFLDRKTVEIDSIIAKKERLIELYEEEKAAVINHAVTKGLDPAAKMKDSGIEWLGEIPEHWEVKRLRYIGDCQNGVSKSGDYFGAGFPFITYGDVYNKSVLPEQPKGLANSTVDDQNNYSVVKGDVFFTRTSETMEEIGIASTCLKTVEQAVFSGFLIRFRPVEGILLEDFSKYYFRANIHRLFFVKEMNLVTRASLSQELLKKLPVLIPPIQIQEEIALYLDQKENIINLIVSKFKRQIELLKEYRTALISEAVTGKIDLRHEI